MSHKMPDKHYIFLYRDNSHTQTLYIAVASEFWNTSLSFISTVLFFPYWGNVPSKMNICGIFFGLLSILVISPRKPEIQLGEFFFITLQRQNCQRFAQEITFLKLPFISLHRFSSRLPSMRVNPTIWKCWTISAWWVYSTICLSTI